MFYERFHELCRSMGVTPTQVARDIGVGQSTVSMWKLQGTTPKYDTLRKLAHYFGASTDYLLNRGPRIDPAFPSRQIIPMMYKNNSSLEDLSQKTGISIDVLRVFGLGGKVENGRKCLEEIAKALHANPAYLMGWTNHEDDEQAYIDITEEMWELSGNDPDTAHGLQQFAEGETLSPYVFQTFLARLSDEPVNIPPDIYGELEGHRTIPIDKAKEIADERGVTLDYLTSLTEDTRARLRSLPNDQHRDEIDDADAELIDAVHQICGMDKDRIAEDFATGKLRKVWNPAKINLIREYLLDSQAILKKLLDAADLDTEK